MSNLNLRVTSSTAASAGVSRSSSSVPNPASWITAATARFRELNRLLPLPCAKMTSPAAPFGTCRSPSQVASPAGILTLSTVAPFAMSHSGWIRFGEIGFVERPAFERFEGRRAIDVEHRVELLREPRAEVVAAALRFRTIDHADGALEPFGPECLPRRPLPQ